MASIVVSSDASSLSASRASRLRASRSQAGFTRVWAALACIALGLVGGCDSGGSAGGPPLHYVSGVVTLGGKPLAEADVLFTLKDGSSSSFGHTDASGRYQLTTRNSNDGAPSGDYLVAISKTEAPPATNQVSQDDPNYNPYGGANARPQPVKSAIPVRYSNPKTSGLTAQVKAESNTLDFNLK